MKQTISQGNSSQEISILNMRLQNLSLKQFSVCFQGKKNKEIYFDLILKYLFDDHPLKKKKILHLTQEMH